MVEVNKVRLREALDKFFGAILGSLSLMPAYEHSSFRVS